MTPRPAAAVRLDLLAAARAYGDEAYCDATVRWDVIRCLELPWRSLSPAERSANRYAILEYVTGYASTKELSDAHILALRDWLRLPLADALVELHSVLRAAVEAETMDERLPQ